MAYPASCMYMTINGANATTWTVVHPNKPVKTLQETVESVDLFNADHRMLHVNPHCVHVLDESMLS